MNEFREVVSAVFASRRFGKFFAGVELEHEGGPTLLKIASCRAVQRAPGYRFAKSSKVTEVRTSNGISGFGYGEDDVEILALQKSIAEAVERCAYKISRQSGLDIKNSNGWAAHLSEAKAVESARCELFERDAALLHWLSATPLKEINPETWPTSLKSWATAELSLAPRFNRLRVLVSHLGLVPIVTTVIQDSSGFGFMSQSGAGTLERAIFKALAETCRIADLALSGQFSRESGIPKGPEGHAQFYAFEEKIPSWLFGNSVDFSQAKATWRIKTETSKIRTDKQIYKCGPLVIARCTSQDVQNLYFGSTEAAISSGSINFERLKSICGMKTLNLRPHFVP